MGEPSVFLTTERLVLRRFALDDADDLLALDSDPLVRRFVEDGEPVTRDHAVERIEHWLKYHERSDTFGFWAAIERATGRFLGWFHFRPGVGHGDDEPSLTTPTRRCREQSREWVPAARVPIGPMFACQVWMGGVDPVGEAFREPWQQQVGHQADLDGNDEREA